MRKEPGPYSGLYNALFFIILALGAFGSLFFMFMASQNQRSILLLGMFTIWILSPFAGFLLAGRMVKRWSSHSMSWFRIFIIVLITIGLFAYSGAFNTPKTKNAFVFLIFPFLSWAGLFVFLLIGKIRSGKKNTKELEKEKTWY